MRVLYISNASTPYKIPIWDQIAKEFDLLLVFEMRKTKERNDRWVSDENHKYKEYYMKSIINRVNDAFCPSVIRLISKYKNELIIISGYNTPTGMLAILYCKLRKIPFITIIDGAMIRGESKYNYIIKNKLISACSYALSSGHVTTEWLEHYGVIRDHIYEYPFTSIFKNDISDHVLHKEEKMALRTYLGLKSQGKIIIAVGRFIKLKKYDVLLKAWKNVHQDNQLVIIGGGEERDNYEQIIAREQLENVLLIDFVDKPILKKYYLASDVFVHPSSTEAWGLVFNEAMSCGLPIIGTNKCVGALEMISRYGNGFLIESNNECSLSEKINYLIENDKARLEMSQRSLDASEDYTLEKSAEKQIGILKDICTKLG